MFTQEKNVTEVETILQKVEKEFPHLDIATFREEINHISETKSTSTIHQMYHEMILKGLDQMDEHEPDWTYVCARIFAQSLYEQAKKQRNHEVSTPYPNFYQLIEELHNKNIYSDVILQHYSRNEIEELGEEIDPARDYLFTYIGLKTLADRYLAKDHEGHLYELPQERFMVIAMTLMVNEERSKRIELVKEAYWALSHLYMTVATPTLANAGKSYGQLSSCFIDTVDDSLQGIFDSNTDIANLSKSGGGSAWTTSRCNCSLS